MMRRILKIQGSILPDVATTAEIYRAISDTASLAGVPCMAQYAFQPVSIFHGKWHSEKKNQSNKLSDFDVFN